MQISGTIKRILETQTKGDFTFRMVHIDVHGQYPQINEIQFVKDKCAILDKYAPGQEVTIDINLQGREWTNPQGEVKVFNTIQGWKITAATNNIESDYPKPVTPYHEVPKAGTNVTDDDGLPF